MGEWIGCGYCRQLEVVLNRYRNTCFEHFFRTLVSNTCFERAAVEVEVGARPLVCSAPYGGLIGQAAQRVDRLSGRPCEFGGDCKFGTRSQSVCKQQTLFMFSRKRIQHMQTSKSSSVSILSCFANLAFLLHTSPSYFSNRYGVA